MKERPILFSAPMVRAILDGRKTQTRRVIKSPLSKDETADAIFPDGSGRGFVAWFGPGPHSAEKTARLYPGDEGFKCPYGHPGDRLWVRENGWQRPERTPRMMREGADTWLPYYFDADGLTDDDHERFKSWGFKRRPSIHMPRWASRITLDITGIRVERLNDISEEDAEREGCGEKDEDGFIQPGDFCEWRKKFQFLWDGINGPGSWAANPWVWVIEFKRC